MCIFEHIEMESLTKKIANHRKKKKCTQHQREREIEMNKDVVRMLSVRCTLPK